MSVQSLEARIYSLELDEHNYINRIKVKSIINDTELLSPPNCIHIHRLLINKLLEFIP